MFYLSTSKIRNVDLAKQELCKNLRKKLGPAYSHRLRVLRHICDGKNKKITLYMFDVD